jgi:hypothetical protein
MVVPAAAEEVWFPFIFIFRLGVCPMSMQEYGLFGTAFSLSEKSDALALYSLKGSLARLQRLTTMKVVGCFKEGTLWKDATQEMQSALDRYRW